MPRRNISLAILAIVFSLLCYTRAERSPYGRYFAEVLQEIETQALEPVPQRTLYEMAVRAALSLLDENSGYSNQAEARQLEQMLEQEFAGIGIRLELDEDTGHLIILSPIFNTPAYQAGIKPGDRILAIDGQPTRGLIVDQAVRMMKGKVGEPVVLRILHAGTEEPVDVRIVRDVIQVESVRGEHRSPDGSWNYRLSADPRLGYVQINAFGARTAEELAEALDWLQERGYQGLVLDLRDNAGGLLEAAVDVCDLFLDSGVIVTTRGRDGQILDTYAASRGTAVGDIPIAVLVNHYSASASEIVAACLQDYDRAVIVGERTWGKGTVQSVIHIEGGQAILRLTTAAYWRPSGRNIHRRRGATEEDTWGVDPTRGYRVPLSDEQQRELLDFRRQREIAGAAGSGLPEEPPGILEVDPQLRRAVEYLREQIEADRVVNVTKP